MRLLYTVQRYGDDIVGGSEAACRLFAEHLAERGHEVHVVTSCARNYTDWADEYAPGTHTSNGVIVHRLPVVRPRATTRFEPLNEWTILGPRPMPLFQQRRWADEMGPRLAGYRAWLLDAAAEYDAVIHMTYLYSTTTSGLPVTSGRVPTILQPTAHDEPALWVRLHDTIFRLPDAFLFFTPEERQIVADRFAIDPPGATVGIGMELHPRADPATFRTTSGIGGDPYLIYVGRIDRAKGALEAFNFFAAYKRRNPGPLKLVFAGADVIQLPDHPDVLHVGFLDEPSKRAALAGSLALLQPSYFESFSIVLCEAWIQRRPALVQGRCAVLAGQATRSGGALAFQGFAEFEAALDTLVDNGALADQLGHAGRRYVEQHYAWARVLDGVEDTIDAARSRFAKRAEVR